MNEGSYALYRSNLTGLHIMMHASQYLSEIVEPTISDFESHPTSPRHAFLACIVTFHMIDDLEYPQKSATVREKFRKSSADFAQVDRIAHAFKHVTTGHAQSLIQPLSADRIISRPPGVWGEAIWDLSRWDDPKGGVTIQDEHEIDLLQVIKRAVEFLKTKIIVKP